MSYNLFPTAVFFSTTGCESGPAQDLSSPTPCGQSLGIPFLAFLCLPPFLHLSYLLFCSTFCFILCSESFSFCFVYGTSIM